MEEEEVRQIVEEKLNGFWWVIIMFILGAIIGLLFL